ncbi:PRD domain-containing protein [Caldifermentibacillus hisashii]|uniref:PRD domain-containing protein n=1 Tax=Caldifermentibacillus hisashii TaxID=996558 RepID=UPI003101AF58
MNKNEVKDKLSILYSGNVISKNALNVTLKTYDYLSNYLNKGVINDSEMFWTHMSMALTRIERGEDEDGPSNDIVNEVEKTPYKKDIEEIIDFINSEISGKLPSGELLYFYLHLHRVFETNN